MYIVTKVYSRSLTERHALGTHGGYHKEKTGRFLIIYYSFLVRKVRNKKAAERIKTLHKACGNIFYPIYSLISG